MSLSIERLRSLSPDRLVLLAAQLQARLEAAERTRSAPIAVVGIGCRFPGGAGDAEGFWRLLRGGGDAISPVPADRWDVDAYFDPDPDAPGRMSTRWGGFIDDVDTFDAEFFGIAPREAEGMDPQQRLLLEVAWEALERAGQAPERLMDSRTGVFVGISGWDYYHVCKAAAGDAGLGAYAASGAAHSVAAGRLSYVLGLRGPNVAVDTACSSSLVAVHMAVQSLRRGECDLALAGGVNAILAPDITIALSKMRMMAPDGRCKAFDADADGFVRAEGCGLVVLRTLEDALARRDPILAVLRGTAINHDGRSHGLTAPNGPAQVEVLRAALDDAGVAPASVGFVEAHGTGTALGDPIELQALGEVYGLGRDRPLLVGSVKTNVGHLESAAGIAGLIKAVLTLQNAEVPPHLHLRTPSPHIPWHRLAITVPTAVTPWPAVDAPRRAAVSSFGFSGTNAHVILEAAPETEATATANDAPDRPRHLFALSARTEPALRALAGRFAAHPATAEAPLADVCFTAAAGRSHLGQRLAIEAQSPAALQSALQAFAAGEEPPGLRRGVATAARAPKIAFLFTGQGAQYHAMGRQLFASQPTFRRAIERCEALLRPHLDRPLTSVLYADPGDGAVAALDDTTYTQAALFAVGYGLAELWRAWGVTPAWVMGHSVGELTAACAAGYIGLEDGIRLIAARGRLMGAMPPGGAMAAVLADARPVRAALAPFAGRVEIAAHNGPDNVVVSGPSADVDAVVADLAGRGIQARRLNVSHAFHSPLMDPMLDAWTAAAAGIAPGAPVAGLVSNVTGRPAATADLVDPGYWRRHAREPVRFADGVRALRDQGCDVFVEIGPNPVLLGMAGRCVPDESVAWLPSLRRGRDDWATLLGSLADLYVRGAPIDWEGFDRDHDRRRRVLPTYPFERQRHWVKAGPFRPDESRHGASAADRGAAIDDGRGDAPGSVVGDRVAALLHHVVWRRHPGLRWGDEDRDGDPGRGAPSANGTHGGARHTPSLPSAAIAGRLAARIEPLRAANNLDRHDALLPRLDALAVAYAVHALRALGWDFAVDETVTACALAARLGIADRHRRLFGRLLAILAEEGHLEDRPSGWRVSRVPPEVDPGAVLRSVAAAFPTASVELTLLGRCGGHLAEVLRGDVDPLEVLFPGGSLSEAERLYQDAPAARTFNALVAEAVAAVAESWPEGRPLRILEIGAGTGGTTAHVLAVLPTDRTAYTFTDVSPAFAAHAAVKFRDCPFITIRTLDITADPADQGFAPEAFDVILAANVLHATPDLRRSLAHVRSLLAPGGRLILLEVTRPIRFGDLTVGLTAGWWSFADPDVRPDYALVSRARWLSLLADSGFEDAVGIPADAEGVLAEQAVILARRPAGPDAAAGGGLIPTGTWLVVADRGGLGARLAARLRAGGARCIVAVDGPAFAGTGADGYAVDPGSGTDFSRLVQTLVAPGLPPLAGVVYLWGLDAVVFDAEPSDALTDAQRRSVGGALHLVQALLRDGPLPPPRMWLVTRGAQAVTSAEADDQGEAVGTAPHGGRLPVPLAVAQAPLWGFGQVVDLEHPELRCTRVDLDPSAGRDADLAALLTIVGAGHDRETALAVRRGAGYAPRLVRWEAAAAGALGTVGAPRFRSDATYLITGGLGGLGLSVARWLVDHGARHLALIGRSARGAGRRSGAGGAGADAQAALREMEALGARVEVARADVADRERLAAVLEGLATRLPPIRGIVHAAGVLADAALLQQSWDRFDTVMAPKVAGTWHLAHAARGLRLDFFALFSSGAAVLGSAGQANHAAANAFLDALVYNLRAAGMPAVSINWGAWAEIGAAARTGNLGRSVPMIAPADGLAALGVALGGGRSTIGPPVARLAALPLGGAGYWSRFERGGVPPLLAELAPSMAPGGRIGSPDGGGVSLQQALAAAAPNRRHAVVLGAVRTHAAAVLGLAGDRAIDAGTPLSELGLDSLMAVELRNRLGRAVGQALPATLLYEHPTIQSLAEHLGRMVQGIDGRSREVTEVAARSGGGADGIADARLDEGRSDDEQSSEGQSHAGRLDEGRWDDGPSDDALAAELIAKLGDLEKRLEDTAHA